MKPKKEKEKSLNFVYTQMLFIVLAFAIMGVSSFFFISNIERRHLIKDAENALAFTEAEVITNFLEYETFLIGYSETLQSMVPFGINEASVRRYMSAMTNSFLNDNERLQDLSNTHGYFFSWGGKYICGIEKTLSEDFNPREQKWFIDAVEANGKVIVSEPYKDSVSERSILTFSRYITYADGSPLGVICLDLSLDRIYRYAISINLTGSSYGILLNNKLEIISHPEYYLIGQKLYHTDSGLSELASELEAGQNIYERRIKNYMYDDSIVFFIKVKYDWYLGIVIPVHEYYRSVNNMAAFLIILGSILASALCTMLYKISQAKMKSDMRTQQKSNFLATMSHEIRTPLNAILGMTEIQMQNTSHPPATSEAFIKINNSGNLLLNIINDILDLSKIEAGKLELVPVKYEVINLINDIVQLNYIRYESKPIEFILDIDENIPAFLVGDDLRIKQILNNLLSNAFKYTDRGQVTFTVNAECVGRGGGAILVTLIFQVKDTGQGMTPDQVSRLFDEYTRFNLEANRTTEGAGLGMTITRNLVELMYGKISVRSEVDIGTTVTVRIPQKTDGVGIGGIIGKEMADSMRQFRHGNTLTLKKSQISHEYMPYGKVLIVDDVETNLYVAKGLMTPYCLNIDLATSGFETIEKVKAGNIYDIIFMDHMMPKMDGVETTRLLREMGYHHPIVALTANALAGQAEVFLRSGFDGFISKPIDIRQLNTTINRLIRDKQPPEVLEAAKNEKEEMDKNKLPDNDTKQVDRQLADIFARDAEKAVVILENCLKGNLNNEDELHVYTINVHAIKSALANIGKQELSDIAQRLEQASRQKNVNVLLTETRSFLEELTKVINEIKSGEKEKEAEVDTKEALAVLCEEFLKIKEACDLFDKKAAKNAMNKLREMTWSHETKELINSLSEHLLHSEFDDAAALIDKYINTY